MAKRHATAPVATTVSLPDQCWCHISSFLTVKEHEANKRVNSQLRRVALNNLSWPPWLDFRYSDPLPTVSRALSSATNAVGLTLDWDGRDATLQQQWAFEAAFKACKQTAKIETLVIDREDGTAPPSFSSLTTTKHVVYNCEKADVLVLPPNTETLTVRSTMGFCNSTWKQHLGYDNLPKCLRILHLFSKQSVHLIHLPNFTSLEELNIDIRHPYAPGLFVSSTVPCQDRWPNLKRLSVTTDPAIALFVTQAVLDGMEYVPDVSYSTNIRVE